MPDVIDLPVQVTPAANEEKSFYYPTGGRFNQKPPVGESKQYTPTKH